MHRSPLAAACFGQILKERGFTDWRAESAGTWALPRQKLPAEVIADDAALGFDLSAHTSRIVDEAMLRDSALVLVMERGQKEALVTEFPARADRVYMLTEIQGGIPYDIPDPFMSPSDGRRILRDMCKLIQEAFPQIMERARSLEGISG